MSISFKASPTPGPLGQHVISEFYGASNLFDPEPVKQVFREAAEAAGATLLGFDMRDFGEGAGFTGVAILAESHISIHTWPEYDYAAIDIFMCGSARPQDGLAVMARYFTPERQETSVIPRGLVEQIHAAVPGT